MDQTHQPPPATHDSKVARVLAEWRNLTSLGGPILIAQLSQTANSVIDTVMAGRYSAQDLAAVGIGSSLWMPLMLFFFGVLSAMQPTISEHLGARRFGQIMPVTWQGLYIAAASSAGLMLLLVQLEPVLGFFRLDRETADIVQGYLEAFSWGVPALMLMAALRGLTDGLGHTRVIMAFSLLAALLNLPLNYVFIYGKLGIPSMGGVGCGWATALSNGLAALAMLAYLYGSRHYRRFHLLAHWAPPQWRGIRSLLRLGLPIGASMFVEVSMFAVIALFLAPLGAQVVAGHQIVLNVVSLVFMVPLSLGMALTLRVSFLRGAGTAEGARLVARTALLLALGIALAYMPLLLWGRSVITSFYTNDPAVHRVASGLLLFAAIFQIADVLQVTAISALRGYRDTRVPLLIMLLSFWGIGLPLGYLLTFTDYLLPAMGASGFWLSLIVGLSSAALLLTTRLWRF